MVVDKAASEVFGADDGRTRDADKKFKAYLLGSLLVLAGTAIAGFLLWPAPQKAPAQKQASTASPVAPTAPPVQIAPQSQPAASAPVATAAAPTRIEPPAVGPLEELEALLPQLQPDINVAWRQLGLSWKLPATEGDPCRAAAAQQLQCYRTGELSVPQLRQLGHPGILTLQVEHGPPLYALLVGLTDQSARLQMADGLHNIRLVSLGRLWRGDFATYWRSPTGYRPDLRDGSAGPAIDHLVKQLDVLDGTPAGKTTAAPQVLDAALRNRVRAFQRAQGLKADGQPGPMTFMQLDSVTGMNQPRLQTESR
jgi:general secretion pathway protein A